MPQIDTEELERRFRYHAPDAYTRKLHDDVRDATLRFAHELNRLMPLESREKSLAFTALEEMSFWTHADIARNR